MEESQKFFETGPVKGEETLVTTTGGTLATPRFDEVEAQVARPVVPLAGNPLKRVGGSVRRRQWPIALVLISALAGGVVSLLAFRLYQQRQQSQVISAQADGETPQINDAQTAEQTLPVETAAAQTGEQAQSESPVVFEEFDPAKESLAGGSAEDKPARKATESEAKPPAAAANEERKEEAKPAPRAAAAEPKPRVAETITPTRQVQARGENVSRSERNDEDDLFEERRQRRRERRERRDARREGQRRNIDRIKDIFEGPPPA